MSTPKKYEPREFTIAGTLHAPASVGPEELVESLRRGRRQSARGETVDLGDFTQYATDDAPEPEDTDDAYVEPERDDSERYYLTCDGISGVRCEEHGPECPGPRNEDTDVEPEPLKEGDWVQVWAQVNRRADSDGDLLLISSAYGEAAPSSTKFYARSDAIVRPSAGQVPPWVKPERCTSLYMGDGALWQCDARPDHAAALHGFGAFTWNDAEEYGRVEVRS